jgi:hypothetical protein
VPIILKYCSLSLLEPSGSVEACNGIVLPLTLSIDIYDDISLNSSPNPKYFRAVEKTETRILDQ